MQKKLLSKSENMLFYMIGLFSTMTALSFEGMSVFYVFILIAILKRLFRFAFSPKRCRGVLCLIACVMVSMILNVFGNEYFNLGSDWALTTTKNSIVFVFLILGITLLYSPEEREELKEPFLYGLYVSSICQLVWAFFQLVFWYVWGISFNEVIFHDFLRSSLDVDWTKTSGGILRIAGISWEPAYFSLAMSAGYILSRKRWLKYLYVIGVLVSSSRTGIILILCVIIFEQIMISKRNSGAEIVNKLIYFTVGFTAVGVIIFQIPSFRESVLSTIMSLIHWDKTISGRSHMAYILSLPHIISNMPFKNFLFGYGFSASGMPYTLFYPSTYSGQTSRWSIENEYINAFLGLGFAGFTAYYTFIIGSYFRTEDLRTKILICCLLIGGMFYVYTGTWIIFYIALCYDEGKK